MYSGEPQNEVALDLLLKLSFERPKSVTLILPSRSSKIFSGYILININENYL